MSQDKVIDTRHEDMIHDVSLDFYGSRLATCSSDRTIKVYDVSGEEQVLLQTLTGHEGPVWEVAWAHPKFGVLLASCSYDRQVIIHREVDGVWSPVNVHKFHESSVNSIAWAPYEHGLALACASSDGKVSIVAHQPDNTWKVTSFDDCPSGTNSVTWAPYSHLGASTGDGKHTMRLATAGCDNQVRVHRFIPSEGGEGAWMKEATLSHHTEWARDVAWVPSGGLPSNMLASCSEDKTVVIWKQNEAGGAWTAQPLPAFPAPVWRLSWSTTGNILAVSCGDNSVTLWKETLGREWAQVSAVPDSAPGGSAGGAAGGAGVGVGVGVMG